MSHRCEADQLFYVVYGIMNAMNGRYFDVDNYLVTAAEISGPWSEPVYIHSVGYDASVFHDDDGRKWIVAVDWETRDDYSGAISIVEYDPLAKTPVGYPRGFGKGCMAWRKGRISPDAMVIITSCAPRAALATATA